MQTKSKPKLVPTSLSPRQEFLLIAGCGAVGGLFAWLTGLAPGLTVGSMLIAFPTAIIGGAIAAAVGIYLITGTDIAQFKRAVCLALLFGISWQPILQTGKTMVTNAITKSQIASAQASTKALSPASDPAAIKNVGEQVAQIVNNLPTIESSALRDQAKVATEQALAKIQAVAPRQPDAAARATIQIGNAVTDANTPRIQNAVNTTLGDISKEQTLSPDLRPSLDAALQRTAPVP